MRAIYTSVSTAELPLSNNKGKVEYCLLTVTKLSNYKMPSGYLSIIFWFTMRRRSLLVEFTT
ncbi:unnamed protein product [Linum tenue]|uniref:Uncharacterized protein n=1 Tax=Linum tenue TaxID=586396 RepID=A0AAV0L1V2_9ROSI|nr:unnamed protein product [Linum tenue]